MMHLIAEKSHEHITELILLKYTKILKFRFFFDNSSEIKQRLGLCALCVWVFVVQQRKRENP